MSFIVEYIDCSKHKPKRKCAIEGCVSNGYSRGRCKVCGKPRYRNLCNSKKCPRRLK